MRLVTLWDPLNPLTPVEPILRALSGQVELVSLTFDQVSHRTQPNGCFELRTILESIRPDALLWIEGGPLPRDISGLDCHKACWLINAHMEPSLVEDIACKFDTVLSTFRAPAATPSCRWMPLCSGENVPERQGGIELLCNDPMSPSQARLAISLRKSEARLREIEAPITLCPSLARMPHHSLYNRLAAGSAVIVSSETDLRDIAHPGEHLLTLPADEDPICFIKDLAVDQLQVEKLSRRSREIANHLHTPMLRSSQLFDVFSPKARHLSPCKQRPTASVLVHCYRYLRRLRLFLDSLANQELGAHLLEIVVADPGSPDGLNEYLFEFANAHTHLQIVHLPLNSIYHRNRGLCINRAFDASRGNTIFSMDGDLVLPPHFISAMLEHMVRLPNRVLGVNRTFLGPKTTEALLSGAMSACALLKHGPADERDDEPNGTVGVLGYCQVVTREAFARARYPEEFDQVNQSDVVFNERLAQYAATHPCFLDYMEVFHLWHPRDWSGAKVNL